MWAKPSQCWSKERSSFMGEADSAAPHFIEGPKEAAGYDQ